MPAARRPSRISSSTYSSASGRAAGAQPAARPWAQSLGSVRRRPAERGIHRRPGPRTRSRSPPGGRSAAEPERGRHNQHGRAAHAERYQEFMADRVEVCHAKPGISESGVAEIARMTAAHASSPHRNRMFQRMAAVRAVHARRPALRTKDTHFQVWNAADSVPPRGYFSQIFEQRGMRDGSGITLMFGRALADLMKRGVR